MEILICTGDREHTLRIPSALIFNSLTATLAGPALLRNTSINARLPRSTIRRMFRDIRHYRAAHPEWCLLEVEEQGQIQLRIRL